MIGSQCRIENKPRRKLCARCATPRAAVCPNCGAAYDPGDTFGGECAAALSPDVAAAAGATRPATVSAAPAPTPIEATGAHGPAIDARRASIRAGLAAIEMATLPDPARPEARAAADSARAILIRLWAQPFLDRREAAMARSATVGIQASR